MIDIHTHVLPFVDDGSDSREKSLEMIRKEIEIGVTDIICTPHFRHPHVETPEKLLYRFNKFKERVQQENLPIELYLGQEISVSGKDIKSMLNNGELLTLNNSRWVLIEFNFASRSEIVETVYELKNSGYLPIVAHFERYYYATTEMAYEIKNEGGFIQINAGSILGDVSRHAKKLSRYFLKNGLADFVASDVHSNRENLLGKAYGFVKKKYGDAAAEVTFNHNARKILKG